MKKHYISRSTKSLLILSGLCFTLFLVRFLLTSEMLGFGLVWNLFLAWVPLFFALIARRYSKKENHILLYLSLGFWLLFFPNAPYIITDLVHLNHLTASLWWFDSLGIFMTAMTGLILGIYSLSIVHYLFEKYWGVLMAWVTVFISILLSGFGIYLGRFSRFNSWDLFTNPVFLLQSSLNEAFNPLAIKLTLVFTLVLSVLYISFRILKVQPDEYQ
ncbi:DUF1361 domain-containing protein [uncultured Arcticibacterium sp.]|uniref:DUF1361 domain-containing protein n=1 Tax=uncultured Arcticibacterium sp. TaxID=2173042 RepID=UPI0030F6E2F4